MHSGLLMCHLQIHFPSFVKDIQETVTELNSQIARGRIRYYGFSNFGPKNLKTYLDAGAKPISNQVLPVLVIDDFDIYLFDIFDDIE